MSEKSREVLEEEAKALLKDSYTVKERASLPVQPMPSQDPKQRIHNMDEVALGYTDSQALLEANRCLNCKNKPCVEGCPVGIDIPAFIHHITQRDIKAAGDEIAKASLLPAICGRVCPQENQCQLYCTVGKMHKDIDQSVSIGRLERYVADTLAKENEQSVAKIAPPTGKKVCVVGSGPASIAAAADLCKAGHKVTMFEALHKGGGVLVYGIPEFRLPKAIVARELAKLTAMGVDIQTNFLVGRTRSIKELMEKDGYDAVFVGSGAGLPKFMGIDGENLVGVLSANEFLTRSNLMKAYDHEHALTPMPQISKVAVFGGGNVAMDAARTALRLGAQKVSVIYRRSENELPARKEEVGHAKEEGVEFLLLHNPSRIIADESGHVKGVELLTCELGEPDASGRRSPVEIPGSETFYEYDTVIVAIGNNSNPLIKMTTEGIETTRKGTFVVNPDTNETTLKGVWAGGDIVLGAATVILAMGQGRKAAKAMNEYLAK